MGKSADDGLFLEAVNHAIRLQANPRNPAALQALAGWRARSPDHEKAWAEIAEIHGMAGSLLAPVPGRTLTRRKLLGGAVLGLGLAGGAGLFGPGLILAARADHLTGTAEIEELALADGSRISLGPDSALALDFAPGRRGMRLLAGMAWCEIAPGSQPFRLRCGGVDFTCQAAALNLSEEAGSVILALDRGEGQIGSGPAAGQVLAGGEAVALDAQGHILRHGAALPGEASAWRSGRLVIEAESLSATVARIARWIPGRVVIADPGLGRLLISGVFDLTRPREALLAAVSPHGAGLRQLSPWLTVVTAL